MSKPFNPLAIQNLAASIVARLEEIEPQSLTTLTPFNGAGIYALYYIGSFPPYAMLSERNVPHCSQPIYIGKAIPSGGRRGIATETTTKALYKRLSDHAKSLEAADNLDISDFRARWLVMDDIWIPLGESAMIRRYTPLWNAMLDGFGNHNPGRGRRNGVRSKWDTFHPGRSWAIDFPPNPETPSAIEQELTEYLRSRLA